MHIKNNGIRIFVLSFIAVFYIRPASAEAFEPMKYLQDASVITAVATAVSQLSSCEENLSFSEETKKEGDEATVSVTLACNKFPDAEGELGRSIVRVEFELNEDSSVGVPLGFYYE